MQSGWVPTNKVSVMIRDLEALGMRGEKFGIYSFRIGTTSAAAFMGYPASEIQEIGHWSSSVYKIYVCPVKL